MKLSELDYLIQEQIDKYKNIDCDFNINIQTTKGYSILINIKNPYNFKLVR